MRHLKLSVLLIVTLSSHYFGAAASPYPPRYGLGAPTTKRQNVTTRTDRIATIHYFKQRVDHKRFKSIHGTFEQRYWLNSQYYKPGGPIFLVIAGGDPAPKLDILSTIEPDGLINTYAKELEGACVVLEHRYFGESLPSKDLSEKSLKRLTIEQSIEDLAYFAQKVKLPGSIGLVHPDTNAWILAGSGYAGTLANWAMLKHKKIFFAGYASSAPARAQEDLRKYWDFARKSLDTLSLGKCSAAIQLVAEHIDKVAAKNDKKEVARLKKLLRLDGVTEIVDVAEAVAYSVKLWDDIQPKKYSQFHEFCDTVDHQGRKDINALLAQWGEWNQAIFEGENDDAFWGTHNKSHDRFTDKNPGRPWFWLQCNELGWFRTAAPTDSLIPRLLDIGNERRICSMHFPKTFPKTKKLPPRIEETNSEFKIARANRMIATVGQYDAWAGSGISFSNISLDRESSKSLLVAKSGFISSDMYCSLINHINDNVFDSAQAPAYAILYNWLQQWRPKRPPSGWKAWLKTLKEKGSKLKAGRA